MKKLLFALITTFSIFLPNITQAGVTLHCMDPEPNHHLMITEGKSHLNCFPIKNTYKFINGVKHKQGYHVDIASYGPGLYLSIISTAIITCPTVKKSALGVVSYVNSRGKTKKGTREFKGVRVIGGMLVAPHIGVFANARGGACFIAGMDFASIGAAIQAMQIDVDQFWSIDQEDKNTIEKM